MKSTSERVPESMQLVYDAIVRNTDDFCAEFLDKEYAALARQLAAMLARKRPSPLLSGGTETWACGIVYALGKVNFLFDKSQKPYMRADELCERFGVAASTGAAKAKKIFAIFRMQQLDPKWTRPSKLMDNPMAWLVSFNGYVIDARALPREVQEEALRKGLIPFIPE
ncbi:MAG: DUF6398 domain-containing protein [Blastocatellia bacterium]